MDPLNTREMNQLRAWVVIDAINTKEQKAAADDVARRWAAWLEDPEHNAPPNPRAAKRRNADRATDAYDAAMEMRARAAKVRRQIRQDMLSDPEPLRDLYPIEHMGWAMREAQRQSAWEHWAEYD